MSVAYVVSVSVSLTEYVVAVQSLLRWKNSGSYASRPKSAPPTGVAAVLSYVVPAKTLSLKYLGAWHVLSAAQASPVVCVMPGSS